MLGDGRCRSQKAWLCWRRIIRAQLWGDTLISGGHCPAVIIRDCHQDYMSYCGHTGPGQTLTDKSLFNKPKHSFITSYFVHHRWIIYWWSGESPVRAQRGKWILGTWYEPQNMIEHGREDCAGRNKPMFSSCLSEINKMILPGCPCQQLGPINPETCRF